MAGFQSIVKPPAPPVSPLANPNAMSGQQLAPSAAGPPDNALPDANSDSATNAQIAAIRQKLNEQLAAIPDVDYEGKYKELMQAQANRPTTSQGPTGLQAAAFALGAPQKAPAIMAERMTAHQTDVKEKAQEALQLKEALLHGEIQQQIQKGDFKKALLHSQSLEDTQRAIAENERQKMLHDYATKKDIELKGQKELLAQRSAAAMARAQAAIAGRKDIAETNKPEYAKLYATTFDQLMRPNPLTGMPDYDAEKADELARSAADHAYATQENIKPTTKPGAPAAPPAAKAATGGYAAWKAAQGK